MSLTIHDCIRSYIIEWAKPEKLDVRRIGHAQDALEAFFGVDRDVTTLKRKDGREYRAKRLEQGVVDSTIRRELGVLMAAMKHAAREERIDVVPFMDRPPDGAPRDRWLTEAEVGRIFEQKMSDRARMWLWIAMGTGARMAAITTLPWKRVDLDSHYIDFRDPEKKVTKKRRVKVAMADFLVPLLKDRWQQLLDAGAAPADLMNVPVIGVGGDIGPEIKRILVAAGIDEKGVRCHVTRHTFVNWALINTKGDVAAVARAVGDSIATMEKHYVHAFPEGTRNVVNATIAPPPKG